MATCSITDPMVVKGEKEVSAFLDAVEDCIKNPTKRTYGNTCFIKDTKELAGLMKKRKALHGY